MTCSLTCGMWPHYSPRCPVQVIAEHLFCERGTVCLIGTVTLTFLRTAIRVRYPLFFGPLVFDYISLSPDAILPIAGLTILSLIHSVVCLTARPLPRARSPQRAI